jgi:hypothetical protein
MNILKIALPNGLHNARCLHASQYENWLSEEHAFHASPSTPSPCMHTETDDNCPTPENEWYSCMYHESDVRYSFAMRCAIVKSTNRLGTRLSRAYNASTAEMLNGGRHRYHPFAAPPLSFVSPDDYKGLQRGFHGQDMLRHRHDVRECLDCKNPDECQHPANGDLCLIMQMLTHPEFEQCPDYVSAVQQFMVVTRVLTTDSVGTLYSCYFVICAALVLGRLYIYACTQVLLYTSVSFPRVLRTAIFSTGIAHHVVDGRVARLITAPTCIELRICRLTANSFHSMRDLQVAHFVHPYISRDLRNTGATSSQTPAQTTVLRAYRRAQLVQKSYLSAAAVPSSPEAMVLFRSSVDNEVCGGVWGEVVEVVVVSVVAVEVEVVVVVVVVVVVEEEVVEEVCGPYRIML